MKAFRRNLVAVLMSALLLAPLLLTVNVAKADAMTDFLNSLGLPALFSEFGKTVGTVGGSVLDPVGTGDNDFLGVDVLNPENDLGLTANSEEVTGSGNKTGSGTRVPLDDAGGSEAANENGLTYESGSAERIRSVVGPEGSVTAPAAAGAKDGSGQAGGAVGSNGPLPGLNDQPVGFAVLGGDSSGSGETVGVAILSGDNSGNGGSAGVAVLSGEGSGNGDSAGVAVLGGANSGNSEFTGIAVLNGANSGNSGVIAVGALNGANSANGGVIGAGVLNGPGSGSGGLISLAVANAPLAPNANGNGVGNNGSCTASGGVGCSDIGALALLDACKDADFDGVCDEMDECLNTPADMPVFLTGCHLSEDVPLVLRGVNFEFDKWDLTAESYPILEQAVKVLNAQADFLVAVDGHTDWMGSDSYNIRLSYKRARTVYHYLVDAGIKENRLVFRGYGESVPVAPNANDDGSDNPAGRAENRRVELNVLQPDVFEAVKEENLSQR
ncbi:OmpA family protein [Zhongshania sp.]|uniref:OmpA family protein n=1 Tax=Zhongshania sp. TaxID=1971902 RepID=UPI003566A95A